MPHHREQERFNLIDRYSISVNYLYKYLLLIRNLFLGKIPYFLFSTIYVIILSFHPLYVNIYFRNKKTIPITPAQQKDLSHHREQERFNLIYSYSI
ncbi:hypothetical protein CPJCM30710_06930 [Clostridium polyendosporum]|uniref:Uncharacterized protein n=1 Tax=Clostridium polyendosporum TaxID=69208 RepID=A0A919RXD2_9CLOT|nr:hypothetical protein CPJCM30710_06930 [Clostridium polyendosporum]